jgi:hypothetical protein
LGLGGLGGSPWFLGGLKHSGASSNSSNGSGSLSLFCSGSGCSCGFVSIGSPSPDKAKPVKGLSTEVSARSLESSSC